MSSTPLPPEEEPSGSSTRPEREPSGPSRRKLLGAMGAGVGLAAVGVPAVAVASDRRGRDGDGGRGGDGDGGGRRDGTRGADDPGVAGGPSRSTMHIGHRPGRTVRLPSVIGTVRGRCP